MTVWDFGGVGGCTGFFGVVWAVGVFMVMYVNEWGCRGLYGVVWAVGGCMELYGNVWGCRM